MKAPAALALAFVLTLPSISAQANDVSGVKLGMSVAEAKAAFTKPAAMKVIPVQTDKVESGFAGWVNPTQESMYGTQWGGAPEEFLAFKGNAENIWYIQKNQRLAKSERYAKQTLLDAVRKKFGRESYIYGELNDRYGTVVVAWEYDQSGKQYFGPYSNGGRTITGEPLPTPPCRMFDISRIGGPSGDNFLPEPMRIYPPDNLQRSCGRAHYVEWTHGNGLVENVAIRSIDSSAILKAIDGKNARADTESKQKIQQQMNKGVKPSL